jgi:hypothetical protein
MKSQELEGTTICESEERMKRKLGSIIALLSLPAAAALGGTSSRYHIIKKIKGPGTGGWDYVTVDQLARRV